jgi:hypothetical protein
MKLVRGLRAADKIVDFIAFFPVAIMHISTAPAFRLEALNGAARNGHPQNP